MKLSDLIAYRNMLKAMIEDLERKGETLAVKPGKTVKEIAKLSVELFTARNNLYTVQSQINKLILEGCHATHFLQLHRC